MAVERTGPGRVAVAQRHAGRVMVLVVNLFDGLACEIYDNIF